MQNHTSFGYRVVAMLFALGATAATLAGIALLAQPVNRGAEPAGSQILAAQPTAVALADDNATAGRLRITVVGLRRGTLAPAPGQVRAQLPCPPESAPGRYARTTAATTGQPSEL